MQVSVQFFSYFKSMAGVERTSISLSQGSTLAGLVDHLCGRWPELAKMRKSMLVAVGVEYQPPDYPLKDGDEVSLFPPVQGG